MPEKIIWNILLVDDDEDDYMLTRQMLAMAQSKEVHLKWAASYAAARQAMISGVFDAVLVDYDMGEQTGLSLIEEMVAQNYAAPLILITGRGGYEVDIEAMQAGATLFLTKSEVNPLLLDRSIRYAIERKQAEIALKNSRQELEEAVLDRTEELAEANRELLQAKLELEARVAGRTAELQRSNDMLAEQLLARGRLLTESQIKEERLARISRLYATISRVNEVIVRTRDAESLYAAVCEVVAEHGFPLVWIGELKGVRVAPVASCGPAVDYLDGIRIEIKGKFGTGPTGTCIREDRVIINPDFATNPGTLPWRERAARFRIRASAAFPLHCQGKVVGAFTLYASEPGAFDAEILSLLEQLSADISYALDALAQERLSRQAEQDLRLSEERFRSLFTGMTESFALHEIICDEKGKPCDYRFLEINPAFEKLTGLKRKEVIGRCLSDILPGEYLCWVEMYGAVAHGGDPVHFENYSADLKQYYDGYAYSPAPKQFAVLFKNVTESKQMNDQLRQSEERYRSLFNGIQEGFYLAHTIYDEAGKPCDFIYLDANPAFERIMGRPRDQIIGKSARELLPNLKPEWLDTFNKVELTGEPAVHSSYSEIFGRYFETFVFRPAEGQLAVLVSDMTDRKKAEEALRASEAMLRAVVDQIPLGVTVRDACSGGLVLSNARSQEIMGALAGTLDQLIQYRGLHPDGTPYQAVDWPVSHSITAGEVVKAEDIECERADGKRITLSISSAPVHDAQRRIIAEVEVFEDVTERKRAEQRLIQQSQLIELSFEPIFVWDLVEGIRAWNQGSENLYGFSKDEAIGQIVHCLLKTRHPVPLEMVLAELNNKGTWSGELRHRAKDGREIIVESRQQLIEMGGRKLVLESNRDVTERKRIESDLRESRERIEWMARFPEENPNPVTRIALDGKVLYSNPPAAILKGWNCIPGQPVAEPFLQLIKQAAARNKEIDQDIQLAETYYSVSIIPRLEAGYANIYGRDILARWQAEQALKLSEERYRTLFTSVKEGFTLSQAIYDQDGKLFDLRVVEANPAAEIANGLERGQFVGKTWRELWPGGEENWLEICNKVFLEGQEVRLENHSPAQDLWYEVHHFKAGQDLLGIIFIDITDRKTAERKIAAEHEWFRTTLASIGDAVVTTDDQGIITFLNPVAEMLSGWTTREAAGLPMAKIFPFINEMTGELADNPIQKVLTDGVIVGLANHTGLVTRHGSIIPIEDSAAPIRVEGGKPLGVIMVFRDVTEKRKKEEALSRSEALYHGIARNIPDGAVYVLDHDMRILAAEGALIEQIGLSREKMEGHTIFDAFDPETLALVEERWRRALAGEFSSYETEFGGRILWSQYLPLQDETGTVLAAMDLTLDITQRKQAEEALREAESMMKDYAQKLERSNRELQAFAVIASHDLQEPLRKIKSFSDLLETRMVGQVDDQVKDLLDRMRKAVLHMQELIDSLLTYSRVTTKAQPFRRADLNTIASEVLLNLEMQAERLEAKIELGELPKLEADPVQMYQLLQNLIGNALKFHRPGISPVIKVEGKILSSPRGKGRQSVEISVRDNGIGFDMKYLDRIFQPFERLHGRSEYEGTGMGLAICKKIVELHNGTITARSVVGEGTTFIVTLPADQGD